MKYPVLIAGLLSLGLSVAGCSYFDTDAPELEAGASEAIDLTDRASDDAFTFPGPAFDQDSSVVDIVRRAADGSVEIYDLDAVLGPQAVASSARGTLAGQGRSFYDPSVEVFPLDDQPLFPSYSRAKPFGGAGMEPVDVLPAHDRHDQPAVESDGRVRIYFDHGSTSLDNMDQDTVLRTAELWSRLPTQYVEVVGYASPSAAIKDEVKRRAANLKVALERAFSVSKALMEAGVPGRVIRVYGHGEELIARPADYLDAEAAARRVEIIFTSGQ